MPVISKTPKGQPSTSESVLSELAVDYVLPKLILEHRSLSKLKSTYVDKHSVNPKVTQIAGPTSVRRDDRETHYIGLITCEFTANG